MNTNQGKCSRCPLTTLLDFRRNIKGKDRYKVIDKISVELNAKAYVCEAAFSNLGFKKVLVDSGTVTTRPKLLVSVVWCIADIKI